jgi:8-oxo-dGTP pyrophosphatase MutT (NUDIX family)
MTKRGAVLVPIVTANPISLIFVERAAHLRRNPGQVGFPGGGAEPIDGGDPVRTALRELREELGVDAAHVKVVGELAELEQRSSGLVITPVVGVLNAEAPPFVVDGDEIVGAFAVPLAQILTNSAPSLTYDGRHIWGFTARILKSFVAAWNAADSALRTAIETASSKSS